MTRTTTEPPSADYRLWDWAGLMGFAAGIAAIAVWQCAAAQRRSTVDLAQLERTATADIPAIVWWLPFALMVVAVGAGMLVQQLLKHGGLLQHRVPLCAISVLGGLTLGLAATFVIWALPYPQPFADPASNADIDILPYYIASGVLGVVAGLLIARRQWRQHGRAL